MAPPPIVSRVLCVMGLVPCCAALAHVAADAIIPAEFFNHDLVRWEFFIGAGLLAPALALSRVERPRREGELPLSMTAVGGFLFGLGALGLVIAGWRTLAAAWRSRQSLLTELVWEAALGAVWAGIGLTVAAGIGAATSGKPAAAAPATADIVARGVARGGALVLVGFVAMLVLVAWFVLRFIIWPFLPH